MLTWSEKCFLVTVTVANQVPTFTITDYIYNKRLYAPVVALLTEINAKLLEQLKSGFKRTINWNKYQSKISVQTQNRYLDFFNLSKFSRSE